ncbi:MAG: hypothetical protein LWX54_03200, partial [Deltaproteobacteria bacterium]|nr:hypothetical protein [Deltaproteobacteria bacterium]
LTSDGSTNFRIKNLTTAQDIFMVHPFSKSSNFYFRTNCLGDFSVSGIFSNSVNTVAGEFREVDSDIGTTYNATHLGYKLIRRVGSPGGAITDTLPNGTTISSAFEGNTCPEGSMFTLTVFPDFQVTIALGTDLEWIGGSTVSPTYGSNILVANKMNIIHFTNLGSNDYAVYIQN